MHLSDLTGKPLEHASLFVHVEIENTGKRKTKVFNPFSSSCIVKFSQLDPILFIK